MTSIQDSVPLVDSNKKVITVKDIVVRQSQVNAFEVPAFSVLGWIKYILGFLLLWPIRVVIQLTLALLLFILLILHVLFFNRKGQPHHPIVRFSVCFFGMIWARVMLFLNGFWFIRERGHRNKKARLIISNHQSCLDMFVFLYKYMPSFVIGEIIAKNGFLGPLSRSINCVSVDRDSGGNSQSLLSTLKKRLVAPDTGRKFPVVCMFPEGATGNGHTLNYFHSGAFVPGEPLQPILLLYHEHFNATQWSVRSWLFHFVTNVNQLTQWLEIQYLPMYYPSEAEKTHPRLYAYNVKQVMTRAAKIGQTELMYKDRKEYEDKRKQIKKRKGKIPQPEDKKILFEQNQPSLTPFYEESIDLNLREYHSMQLLPTPEILALIEAKPNDNAQQSEVDDSQAFRGT
ncbi:putative Lysophospholipid acyltransferase LPEAT1 [Blattamonas nauphoetae]|uniref:Lysophospholipid acyltransferase LPEAT1 n=1 Tax=Blattamonas nauphoetae TaxID=2049346 RepID=A0ABQ9WU78_9EUKA|nr:putative Lysophospholipid acyltransferase LPEAT1 [Blattamonas nauphoetae]